MAPVIKLFTLSLKKPRGMRSRSSGAAMDTSTARVTTASKCFASPLEAAPFKVYTAHQGWLETIPRYLKVATVSCTDHGRLIRTLVTELRLCVSIKQAPT